jgi:tetratricopeptide (TPR) repeat protein
MSITSKTPQAAQTISREAMIAALETDRFTDALSIARAYAPLKQDEESWYTLASLEAAYGEVSRLEAALKKVIEIAPQNIGARYNLGVLLQQQHRAMEAISQYQIVLSHVSHPQAKSNLGLLYLETGDTTRAVEMLEQSTRDDPRLVEAKLNLGLAYIQAQRFEEAEKILSRTVEFEPANGRAWHSLGLCAEMRQDEKAAVSAYSRGVAYAPTFIDSYVRLGRILAGRGDIAQAEKIYKDGLVLSPESYELHLALGHLLSQIAANGGDYKNAYAIYVRAEAIRSDDARLHYAYGWLKFSEGKTTEAITRYERALAIDPNYQEAMAGYATVLERQGKFDDARRVIAPALASSAPHSLVLLAESQLAKTSSQKALSVERMQARVVSESNQHWRCDLYFALGKLQDELKQYDAAFAHFFAGNEIEKRPFDSNANNNFFRRIQAVYAGKPLTKVASITDQSLVPVFIVGMPRSGTSLIEQILASHPQVYGGGELTAINYLMTNFDAVASSGGFPEGATHVSEEMLARISESHLRYLRELILAAGQSGVTHVTDKMPHNFVCLGLIAQLFPNAKIIHCLRDPTDTCLSIYFQHFNTHHPYANDLQALGQYYRQYEQLMAHWRQVLPIPLFEIRYEDMVANQEALSRQLVEFIGLDWDERCLSFFSSKRNVNTPSYDQVRRPIYTQSIARWRYYEKNITPLLAALAMADVTL